MAKAIVRDQKLENLKNLSSLSGQHLRQAILDYNLIICTPTFVLDTTNYNLAEESSIPNGQILATPNGDIVTLIKNHNGSKQVEATTGLTNKDGYAVIAVKTITKIIIKSRRNFMNNQQTIEIKKG